MPISLSNFKDLLEAYFAVKNAPETEPGNKKDKLDDIKMEIYDSYLNEDFERNSNVSPAESKVMENFFSRVDNYEREYMESGRFTNAELGNISNGLALQCAVEFTQNFVDYDLLKDEIKEELLRASKKKKYKKKSKKKSKKKRTKKKNKSKKIKSKNQKGGEPFLITLAVATALGLPGAFLGEAVKDGFEDHTELKKNSGKYISILSKILLDDQLKKLKDLKKQKEQLSFEEKFVISPEPEIEAAAAEQEPAEEAASAVTPGSEIKEGIPPTRSSLQSTPELNDIDQEILQLQTHVFQLIMALQTKERIVRILQNVTPPIERFHQRLRKSVTAQMGALRPAAARGSIKPDTVSKITEESPLEEIAEEITNHISTIKDSPTKLSDFYRQVIDSHEELVKEDLRAGSEAGAEGGAGAGAGAGGVAAEEAVTDDRVRDWLSVRNNIVVSKIGEASSALRSATAGNWGGVPKQMAGVNRTLKKLDGFFVDDKGDASHTNNTHSGAILKEADFFDKQKTLIIIIKLLAIVEAESKTLAEAEEYLKQNLEYEINNSNSPMTFAYVKRLIAAMG